MIWLFFCKRIETQVSRQLLNHATTYQYALGEIPVMDNKIKKRIGLVLIILCILLAYLFLKPLLIPNKEIIKSGIMTQQKDVKSSAKTITEGEIISNANVVVNIEQSPAENSARLKIQVQVQDIFPGKSKGSGFALISYNKKPQQAYVVGASLSEGVILKSLSVTEVVIDNHGKLEKYQSVKRPDNKTSSLALEEKPLKETIKPKKIISQVIEKGPPMDGSTPPPPPPKELIQPEQKEFIPPPPDGGITPGS